MFEGLWYAALYGFLLAFAVGPVFFTLLETSITKGFRAGVVFDLGAIFADVIFIFIEKSLVTPHLNSIMRYFNFIFIISS